MVNFNSTNGASPTAELAFDSAGHLYGTTGLGGPYDNGTVFQLTPPAPGKTAWTRKTLVNFNGTNGALPAAGLVIDKAGKFYGTTNGGGSGTYGFGTVFQLTPPAPGQTAWTRKTLFNFNSSDGASPIGNLVLDSAGHLYGTTFGGGKYNVGTVFQLTPPAAGQTTWTYKTLFNFNGTNGGWSNAGLVRDADGKLYGTTFGGGKYNVGTVFRLTPPAPGKTAWTHTILVNFNGTNGSKPSANLVFDTAGHLYGTTRHGGAYDLGTVFQLTPPAPGKTAWTFKKLVDFEGSTNGEFPEAGLVIDAAGKLYGTTFTSGTMPSGGFGFGTVFQLTP